MLRDKQKNLISNEVSTKSFSGRVWSICVQLVFALVIFGYANLGANAQSTIRFNDPNPLIEAQPNGPLGQGARYRFRNVAPGADALVTVTTINTATLVSIDSVLGFADRFEPTIRLTGSNNSGYVRFDFEIVEQGTNTPKIVPAVFISAQDIDGNSATNAIREWVEFVNTGPVSVASPTTLVPGTPVNGGIRYNQVSSNNVQPGIGTNDRYEMYTTVLGSNHQFTIIGGNINGSSGCSGGSCSRQNSYSFDPISSNQPPPNSDVSITKSGPATAVVGDTISYTLVASNSGPTSADGAIVNDSVPAQLSNVTITCSAASGAVCPSTAGLTSLNNVYIPNLPNGGTLTFTINGTTTATGTINNTASIAPPNGGVDNNPTNNTSQTVVTNIADVPDIALLKNCVAPANCTSSAQLPGTELSYEIDFTNSGGSSASGLVIVDAVPDNTDYKIGSASSSIGTTGLTFAIEFSSDYNPANPTVAAWTYTPVSGAGGADTGYDRNVKAIRWRVTAGSLAPNSPNNTGGVSFVTKIR